MFVTSYTSSLVRRGVKKLCMNAAHDDPNPMPSHDHVCVQEAVASPRPHSPVQLHPPPIRSRDRTCLESRLRAPSSTLRTNTHKSLTNSASYLSSVSFVFNRLYPLVKNTSPFGHLKETTTIKKKKDPDPRGTQLRTLRTIGKGKNSFVL